MDESNRDLNILLSLAQTISYSLNSKEIIDSALEIIDTSLGIKGSYALIYDDGSTVFRGHRGFQGNIVSYLESVDLSEGVISTVKHKPEPLIINCINGSTDAFLSALSQAGYFSFLAVPLTTVNEARGLMGIATHSEYIFNPIEVSLFKAVGREIIVAIANSQLFEEASNARALRELDAIRTELLANVSHELRTPLAAIKGFASSLLQPDISFDDETRQSFIQTIDSEADRLSHLIDDLLLMSKIEAGAYKARKEWFDIREIIDAIKDRLYSISIKHNLRIIIPVNLPPVLVDGARIGEVITNLVENAVKYSNEGSEIRIEVEPCGHEINFHVIDNGIGIPKEYQSMVFDRFIQLSGKNGQRKGSGLGLCICRGIVESHGGRIWLESGSGIGTRFSFSIPVDTGEGKSPII